LAISLGGHISQHFNSYKATLFVGAALCIGSLVSVLVYALLDKISEKYIVRPPLPKEIINFRAVRDFDPRFWLISFIVMTYYAGVTPFVAIATDFIQEKWAHDDFVYKHASLIASLVILASMVLSPFLGKFLDTVGYRPYWIAIGAIALIPAHFVLAFTHINPLVSVCIIGLSFSLVPSALWPSIPLIIPEASTATAFGLMTSIQNLGLTIVNYVVNVIAKNFGYNWSMVFFVCMDCLGLLLTEVLIIFDRQMGGQLNRTTAKPKEIEEQETAVN